MKAAKTLIESLRELEGDKADDADAGDASSKKVWEKPYVFDAPNDGKLRFRDLSIGEQFHFMGSWPGAETATPGHRTYTKVSNRRFSFKDGDNVTVYSVRGDLVEVARAVPEAMPGDPVD
jgi:hypothetical protein